jgi:hypothetical protein
MNLLKRYFIRRKVTKLLQTPQGREQLADGLATAVKQSRERGQLGL